MVFDPFLAPIEEHLAFIRVEFPGDVERAAEVVTILVVVERRRGRSKTVGIGIARPRVRVESIILQVFVCGAVEVLRAGLGDDSNLRAGGTAVLGGVIRREELNLLCGVHIGRANAGAVGARTCSGSSIKRDQVFRVA